MLLVHANLHAERVFQVEERLFHIANHHGNVIDTRFFELANLTFDKRFAAHAQNTFRALIRQRNEA